MKQLLMTTLLLAPLAVSSAWSQAARAYVSTGGSYLGVGIRDVTSEDVEQLGLSHERGVYITDVQEGSPAEQVGIQEADVILGYSGVPVLSARQFQRMVGDTPRGREVEISLVRDRFTISVTPKVGSRRRGSSPHLDFFPHFEEEGGFRVAPFDRGKGRLSFSSRPRLGIRGEALTEQLADYFGVTQGEGVLITEVIEGTPAEEAALRAGDVIVSANGARVASVSDLSRQLGEDVVELEIVREQRVQTVTAELKQKKRQRKGSSIRL